MSCPWGQGSLWCGCPAGHPASSQAPKAAGSSSVDGPEKGKSGLLTAAWGSVGCLQFPFLGVRKGNGILWAREG